MPAPRSTEDKLSELNKLAGKPVTPESFRRLVEALNSSSNIVAAGAASVMGSTGNDSFVPHLIDVFKRLAGMPYRADKGCWAKEAICLALESLHNLDPEPYLIGIQHVQMEPVFGGKEDAAANLRSHCAVALVRMRYRDTHLALTPLLFDPEPGPRKAAVDALSEMGGERSELLLRAKISAGDTDENILGKCFEGLLAIAPERSLPFVTSFLDSEDRSLAGLSVYALGASRLPEAFQELKRSWENNADLDFRKPLLLAMAMLRSDQALDYLLEIVIEGDRTSALTVIEALSPYTDDDRRRKKIKEAVELRNDPRVSEAFSWYFN